MISHDSSHVLLIVPYLETFYEQMEWRKDFFRAHARCYSCYRAFAGQDSLATFLDAACGDDLYALAHLGPEAAEVAKGLSFGARKAFDRCCAWFAENKDGCSRLRMWQLRQDASSLPAG